MSDDVLPGLTARELEMIVLCLNKQLDNIERNLGRVQQSQARMLEKTDAYLAKSPENGAQYRT